jgi:amino acid permease
MKYTSFVALVSIGYLIVLVVGHFIKGDTMNDRGAIHLIKWAGPIEALSTFPVVVFAYTCHQNVGSSRRPLLGIYNVDSLTCLDVCHFE